MTNGEHIVITEADLEPVEANRAHGEGLSFSDETISQITTRTKELALSTDHEFWVYVLRRQNGNEMLLNIGRGHSHGIAANDEETINELEPYIREGYTIVADYHNHPQASVLDYELLGMNAKDATTPSSSDIDNDFNKTVAQALGLNVFPRLIGVYLPEQDTVHIEGYRINRDLGPSEETEILIDEPIWIKNSEVINGIRIELGRAQYSKRAPLIEKGILTPINISGEEIHKTLVITEEDLLRAELDSGLLQTSLKVDVGGASYLKDIVDNIKARAKVIMDSGATEQQIFRLLASKYHPDKYSEKDVFPLAEEYFKTLNALFIAHTLV